MGLDIRLPIGMLFVLVGAVLTVFGAVADPSIYARSLGYNVNLWWGVFLLCGGLVMLLLSWRAGKAHPQ